MEGLLDTVYFRGPQKVFDIFAISLFCWNVLVTYFLKELSHPDFLNGSFFALGAFCAYEGLCQWIEKSYILQFL